jgi:wyosine [tRNA(Phe)-imidazoG37] synthetase (radical SAM superfamily)
MAVFLFDEIIFGPVKSRRLGISLGINLLPTNLKVCNFNCIYCECGWTNEDDIDKNKIPSAKQVKDTLREKLKSMKETNDPPDVITFAGNGEPTLHPEFIEIINDTLELRKEFFPKTRIAVLSNATTTSKPEIREALNKVDQNILKIDSAFDRTIQILNNPPKGFTIKNLVDNLKLFNGNLIVQTMFVKGAYNNQTIDNSSNEEVDAWLKLIKQISPGLVMVYTIARDTPSYGLFKVSAERLHQIADKVINMGILAQVSI